MLVVIGVLIIGAVFIKKGIFDYYSSVIGK